MSKSRSLARLFMGFILTATGVHTSCPIELNPSTVVVRYGDPVSINCSTLDSLVESMGWEVTHGATGMWPVKHLTWTLESLTEWTINPSCFINLLRDGADVQCDKMPNIVLYTFPENISISSNSDSGGVNLSFKENEEYNLKCDIKHIAPVQNLTVRWYKGDKMIHTDTFSDPNKKPVNTSSSLTYAATRHDNGVTFRCEAHMDLRPEGPQLHASSQDYIVTVNFGPDLQCSSIELLEGETLESKCPVVGNPVPFVMWRKDGQSVNLSVPLSRENAGNYRISAEGFSSIDETVEVLVLHKPELNCPSTYTAPEFTPHNITCTVEGYPKPDITWSKDGEEITFPEILTRSDAGQYVIAASNALSSVNATLEITVIYPPSEIFELEDSEVEIGSDVRLKCSSMGNPRPKYFWNYYRIPNVKEEGEDGVSYLLIHNATAYNIGSYTCQASNERGKVSKTVRLTVRGAKQECPIEISPKRMVIQYRGPSQIAKCTNTSDSKNYIEKFWQVTSGIRNNSESWSADTHKDWDAKPLCNATIKGIGTCGKPLDFTLYKTPDSVFISANVSSVMEGREFQLQCDIINVAPAQSLAVRWYRGNHTFEPLVKGSMQVSGCVPENNINCNISLIRTPVNVSSTIRTTLNRMYMSVQFRCEAELNLGLEGPQPPPIVMSSPLNITVDFKPVINTTKIPKTMPVFRGYPEELVCEAEGHPSPKIQWLYSSDKVAHESGSTLTVTEAGLYNCTATNEVGSSFHVVEVILKEDYLPLIAGFVAVTVVAISVVFLFIYSIYYKNTKMRRYSLKNPKFGNHNGNVAHNGWDLQFPMTKLS